MEMIATRQEQGFRLYYITVLESCQDSGIQESKLRIGKESKVFNLKGVGRKFLRRESLHLPEIVQGFPLITEQL